MLLLVCAAVFLRGAVTAATKSPGIRSDVLRISLETESRRGALVQALKNDPLVETVAASSPATRGVVSSCRARSGSGTELSPGVSRGRVV